MGEDYVRECEARRKSVERALAIVLTATKGPTQSFMDALDDYIFGKLSLEELELKIERLEFMEA